MSINYNRIEDEMKDKINENLISPPSHIWSNIKSVQLEKSIDKEAKRNKVFRKGSLFLFSLLFVSVLINFVLLHKVYFTDGVEELSTNSVVSYDKEKISQNKPVAPIQQMEEELGNEKSKIAIQNEWMKSDFDLSRLPSSPRIKKVNSNLASVNFKRPNTANNKGVVSFNNINKGDKAADKIKDLPSKLSSESKDEISFAKIDSSIKLQDSEIAIAEKEMDSLINETIPNDTVQLAKNKRVIEKHLLFNVDLANSNAVVSNPNNIGLGNKLENSFSYGVNSQLGFELSNRFTLYAGLGVYKQTLKQHFEYDSTVLVYESIFGRYNNLNGLNDDEEHHVVNNSYFLQIPLRLSYKLWEYNKFDLQVSGGVTMNFLLSSKTTNSSNLKLIEQGSKLPSYFFNYDVGLGANYQLNNNYALSISPFFRKSLAPLSSYKSIAISPYSVGCTIGIKKQF